VNVVAEPVVRTDALVVCDGVGATFRHGPVAVEAVRAVSCSVRPGMHVALTGPSGSGKSTLLHLMAGLTEPSEGRATWPGLGRPPREPGAIGVVFQGPSLVPELDVLENVMLPLLLAGTGDRDARRLAGPALDRLRIGDLARALPDELSGGQSQRVAVARVLAGRPRLILADEPTGRLDRAAGTAVVEALLTVADEIDAGLVVSTHDPDVAGRLAHRWRMDDGRLTTGTDA
jgi:ABC-type lipoprotein export system ATPase subunit